MEIKTKLKISSIFLIGIVLVLGLVFFVTHQQAVNQETVVDRREEVKLGFTHESLEALIIIAEDQGFFSQQGLDITISEYASGKLALEAMFRGEIDVAPVAETPVVFNSFKRQDFSVIATIGAADDQMKIIARKDSGIQKPADLRGKRIVTQRASAAHIFLHLFLINNGLSEKDVEISFKKAVELPEAIGSGEVDAISMKEPIIGKAKALLGDNAVIFNPRGIYYKTFNLVAFNSFIEKKPEVSNRILSALIKAEDFTNKYPDRALSIFLEAPGVSTSEVRKQWPTVDLHVSLDQWFLLELEDEARWAITNNLTDKTEVPNYLNFIYINGLQKIKPEAVTIIR